MLEVLLALWKFLQPLIQIGALALLLYAALLFLRGTRASIMLMGIIFTTFVVWFFAQQLDLEVIEWLLGRVPAILALTLVIIFQPELRRAFAEIGSNPQRIFREQKQHTTEVIDALIETAFFLGERQIGALIVVERDIPMRAVEESGVAINAPLSPPLLSSIFLKNPPLRGGAAIVKGNMITAASCFISKLGDDVENAPHELGSRHRAGIGITEETDALAIIVSEETGSVSLAYRGRLVYGIERRRLMRHLHNFLIKKKQRADAAAKKSHPIQAGVQELTSRVLDENGEADSQDNQT